MVSLDKQETAAAEQRMAWHL